MRVERTSARQPQRNRVPKAGCTAFVSVRAHKFGACQGESHQRAQIHRCARVEPTRACAGVRSSAYIRGGKGGGHHQLRLGVEGPQEPLKRQAQVRLRVDPRHARLWHRKGITRRGRCQKRERGACELEGIGGRSRDRAGESGCMTGQGEREGEMHRDRPKASL
jgi:hypothetical protein